MPSYRAACVPVLIAGLTGTITWAVRHHAPDAVFTIVGTVVTVISTLLAALPRLAETVMRWRTNEGLLQEHQVRMDVLRRLAQDDSQLLALLAQLPAPNSPLPVPLPPSEGPAPPEGPQGEPGEAG